MGTVPLMTSIQTRLKRFRAAEDGVVRLLPRRERHGSTWFGRLGDVVQQPPVWLCVASILGAAGGARGRRAAARGACATPSPPSSPDWSSSRPWAGAVRPGPGAGGPARSHRRSRPAMPPPTSRLRWGWPRRFRFCSRPSRWPRRQHTGRWCAAAAITRATSSPAALSASPWLSRCGGSGRRRTGSVTGSSGRKTAPSRSPTLTCRGPAPGYPAEGERGV